ncbi:tryptophan-rich sensory protein [Demequina aurantiaca]|uniref:tryptophan-rich sensory protein n=1 Tax=Demequina aurantiaca TaxID=676200 RepID=UPI003D357906
MSNPTSPTSPTDPSLAPPATRADTLRRWAVLIGAVGAIVGAAYGSGAFGGTPIAEAAGGALAADATLLAPATAAFGIWSFIYLGLAVFAVFQFLPRHATDPRLRATAWLVLVSMLLNAAWIGVVQAGALWASVIVIVALVIVLSVVAARLASTPPSDWRERLTTDVPVGLYLGWVVVATIANATAVLAASDGDFSAGDGMPFAIAALVMAAALSIALARGLRASPPLSMATGFALAWGLWWIAVGRLTDSPANTAVGWAAGLAAIVALATPFAIRDFSYVNRKDPLAPQ